MKRDATHTIPGALPARRFRRGLGVALLGAALLASCGGGGSASTGGTAKAGGNAELIGIEIGRLADVYGLKTVDKRGRTILQLYQKDMLVGPDIQDERQTNENKLDSEVLYDFIGFDPDTLQPKLLITREIGSPAFRAAVDALDDKVIRISPGYYGQDTGALPFSVAPRNGGIRLRFNKDLGVTEDFFLVKDENDRVIGIRNNEAVQLLEILGDPTDGDPRGDFRLIPTRIAYKGDQIILDPVLLGAEGALLNVPNNASGLPESQNSSGANIRIAIALEGPLRLRGLRQNVNGNSLGTNLAGQKSLIRDFRSGNAKDDSVGISRGFIRDVIPPRMIGELPMRLEKVEILSPTVQRLTIYKAGIKHEFDRGDVIKLFPPGSEGKAAAVTEIVEDPDGDKGKAAEQHVTVLVRDATLFENYDPAKRPGYPTDLKLREPWLIDNAPIAVLSTEFNGDKDNPTYFLNFSPPPVQQAGKTFQPNKDVSPFASVIVRFSKPVDLATVKSTDSLILATSSSTKTVLTPKDGTPHLIYAQVFDEDGSATAVRLSPPFGFYLDDTLRAKNRPYYLHLIGGNKGIRDFSGNPVDLQFTQSPGQPLKENISIEFFLDTRRNKNGEPLYPNNRVVNLVRRFLAADEDEDSGTLADLFGAFFFFNGKIHGRPTTRVSAYADDKNQIPSPSDPALSFCPSGTRAPLTALTTLKQPIQNPLNPLGCRLQTVWREIDLSLSRTDPFDFNLDVEQMWWAPFQDSPRAPRTSFDIFDRLTLYLGHSERRPSPCVGNSSALPFYPSSGLNSTFYLNYARNMKPQATSYNDRVNIEERPAPHPAFLDQTLVFRHRDSVFEPNKIRRYLPLPTFQKPYFTWRDERSTLTGGGDGEFSILSPFKTRWDGSNPYLRNWRPEDGRIGTIALPLLADFWSYPDDPNLPKGNPWKATGANGWQIAITVTSSPMPVWRAYSAGGRTTSSTNKVNPASQTTAQGGWTPTGGRTRWGDNTFYWARFDFLKRFSVATSGFIPLADPHNAAKTNKDNDPRLGPYTFTPNTVPKFDMVIEPPLSSLPNGTKIIPQFRGADVGRGSFAPYDPLVAGDAHVRRVNASSGYKWDYQYTQRLTKYTEDPNKLFDSRFLSAYYMAPKDTRLMNFRFIFENNVETDPPILPSMDTFALIYRIEEKP